MFLFCRRIPRSTTMPYRGHHIDLDLPSTLDTSVITVFYEGKLVSPQLLYSVPPWAHMFSTASPGHGWQALFLIQIGTIKKHIFSFLQTIKLLAISFDDQIMKRIPADMQKSPQVTDRACRLQSFVLSWFRGKNIR